MEVCDTCITQQPRKLYAVISDTFYWQRLPKDLPGFTGLEQRLQLLMEEWHDSRKVCGVGDTVATVIGKQLAAIWAGEILALFICKL